MSALCTRLLSRTHGLTWLTRSLARARREGCCRHRHQYVIALVRGGVFGYLGRFFEPLYIGNGAERERRKDPLVDAALNRTQLGSPSFPTVETRISRRRAYDPGLSQDIQGIELAPDRSALRLTQDDLQTLEAQKAGLPNGLHTLDLLDGFKRQGLISSVRDIVLQMEQNGEHFPKAELNRLFRRVNAPVIP